MALLHSFLPFVLAACVSALSNPIYVISNAETPSLGLKGLTPVGQQRAQTCLPKVFGPSSEFNIGLIIACTPHVSGVCVPAVNTVAPLAAALGIPVNANCGTGEDASDDCVSNTMERFAKTSNAAILISWDPYSMDDLMEDIDVECEPDDWPFTHSDVVWKIQDAAFISQTSQGCDNIDGTAPGSDTTSLVQAHTKPHPDSANGDGDDSDPSGDDGPDDDDSDPSGDDGPDEGDDDATGDDGGDSNDGDSDSDPSGDDGPDAGDNDATGDDGGDSNDGDSDSDPSGDDGPDAGDNDATGDDGGDSNDGDSDSDPSGDDGPDAGDNDATGDDGGDSNDGDSDSDPSGDDGPDAGDNDATGDDGGDSNDGDNDSDPSGDDGPDAGDNDATGDDGGDSNDGDSDSDPSGDDGRDAGDNDATGDDGGDSNDGDSDSDRTGSDRAGKPAIVPTEGTQRVPLQMQQKMRRVRIVRRIVS